MADQKVKEVTLLNQGIRAFHGHTTETKEGKEVQVPFILGPGKSVTLSVEDAQALIGYPEIVDMAKIAPKQKAREDALRAENEELKKELEDIKATKKGGK